VFKPALARGELYLIGATTLDEFLRGLRSRLEAHHKVKIPKRRSRPPQNCPIAGAPIHVALYLRVFREGGIP